MSNLMFYMRTNFCIEIVYFIFLMFYHRRIASRNSNLSTIEYRRAGGAWLSRIASANRDWSSSILDPRHSEQQDDKEDEFMIKIHTLQLPRFSHGILAYTVFEDTVSQKFPDMWLSLPNVNDLVE